MKVRKKKMKQRITNNTLEDYEPSDFEYVMSALSNVKHSVDNIKLDDLYYVIRTAKNGKQFDAGVSAYIKLKEIENGRRKTS